ncbi:MAG: DUF2934 domain-containing protein [Myxococcales bacterium]|nr:DUF2934 domain-containing protein [Myxococcales bacterium]
MKPHIVRFVSVGLTPKVGANDALLGVRVVPAGRDGHKVLGRTLADGEADSGEPVTFFPYAGEELHFPAGSVQIFLRDLDRGNNPGPDGYAPVSNTLWSWLLFGAPPDPALFRYLFAAARRLDTAHSLCADVLAALTDRDESFIRARQRMFAALGHAELMCVAAGRAIDMLRGVQAHFSVSVTLPPSVLKLLPALHEFRNAFEHIEDRALGNVRKKPHADALSIFDQRDLISQGVLRYAAYSLDLRGQLLPMLVDSRMAIFQIASAVAGSARTVVPPISFPSTPPGSYERIQERAYFLWENRTGSAWWDPDSNWSEAERNDAAEFRRAG